MMDLFNTRIAKFLGWLFGLAGILATYVSGWALIDLFWKQQNTVSVAPTLYILILTFAVIVFSAVRQFQTMRKEKYANITCYLHSISHQLRDIQTLIHDSKLDERSSYDQILTFLNSARKDFSPVLDQLAHIFTSLTGTRCRACIKLTYALPAKSGEQKLYFYTYQRDTLSAKSLHDHDNKRVATNHDPHEDNPQFAAICDGTNSNHWHFFSNDLISNKEFNSTSLTAYDHNFGKRFKFTWMSMLKGNVWPLPYKSCLSCVIRQGPINRGTTKPDAILGFLSVDSESRNVFLERWDKEIVFLVADALYWPLREILRWQQVADARAPETTLRQGNISEPDAL